MCLFPVRATKQDIGRPKLDPEGDLGLPCGKCYECLSKRAYEWSVRCRHEIACHEKNCFITLTYDDMHLPSKKIVKSYFQKFMKKLRRKYQHNVSFKYIVSHEYGGKTGRPHHHAIIFGWTPSNQEYLQKAPSGEPLYTSKDLEELWPYGYHSIGDANERTAFYIASYSLKSNTNHFVDPTTGETMELTDSMDSSRKTAIGYEYFMKYYDRLASSGELLPRYYVKLLDRHFPDYLEIYENNLLLNFTKQKSSQQKLAKFVITSQKEALSQSGYRTAPDKKKEIDNYKNILRHDRDMYVQHLEKLKCKKLTFMP